jgi:hypothetical protein
MQRLNLVNHKLNLKYGIGFELNNYHFDQQNVLFQKNPNPVGLPLVVPVGNTLGNDN